MFRQSKIRALTLRDYGNCEFQKGTEGLDAREASHNLSRYERNYTESYGPYAHIWTFDPTTPLLYVLADDLELRGDEIWLRAGQCGLARSSSRANRSAPAITPVETVDGTRSRLSKVGNDQKPHPIQKRSSKRRRAVRFLLECGYYDREAFLDKKPKASEEEIQQAMSGVFVPLFHARADASGDKKSRTGNGPMRTSLKNPSRNNRKPLRNPR